MTPRPLRSVNRPVAQPASRPEQEHAATDWWIHGVLPLALIDLALYRTLQARPGRIAVTLWTWGPGLLVVASGALLAVALISATRRRASWTWRRAAGLAALVGLVFTATLYRTYPSSYDEAPSAVEFVLPLDGPVTVAWGGQTGRVNHHVNVPAERWAYDLLVTIDGVSHSGRGDDVDDYYVYSRPVHAPAGGRVVSVQDGAPDALPGRPSPGRGNDIVLEVATGQYLVVAHLKASTIRVTPGQRVSRGDELGLVGNSGNSSEPHVHLHLEDSPVPGAGEGIPLLFSRYVAAGGNVVTRGLPRGGVRGGRFIGDVVTSVPASEDR